MTSGSIGAGVAAGGGQRDVVDLVGVVRGVLARWKAIAAATVIGFGASVFFVMTAEPSYRGETQILLESRETAFTRPVATTGGDETVRLIDEQAVQSQVEVLRSRDVAREAIRRLGLVGNPEFDPAVRPMNPVDRIRGMIGLGGPRADQPPEERILKDYFDRLLVYSIPRSRVLTIEFQSRDPELAARGSNVIAEVYLAALERAKIDAARSASSWLAQNIERLRDRVREAEARVEEFRSGTGLLVGANNATLTSQQLDNLSVQLAEARSRQADAEARATLIREQIAAGRSFDIPDVANNDLIRNLLQERVQLRSQIANESRTLLPRHPRILALEAQLETLDAQIRGAAERTVRALENEARLAGERVATISAALDRQMGVAARANENEVQLRALEREARAEREQLEAFLARYRDAVARDSEEATLPDARIVSRAATPEAPIFPKKIPVTILGTLGAFGIALTVALMRELVFDLLGGARAAASARGSARPEDEPEAPAAEPTPPEDRPPPPSGRRPRAPRGAAPDFDVRALVARLSRTPAGASGRLVLVAGLDAGLARLLGERLAAAVAAERPALLVQLDRFAAATARPPAGEATIGLAELVLGEARFFEAIARAAGAKTHRVAAGLVGLDPLDPEVADALAITLAAFAETYDWSVLVLPDPADPGALAAFAPLCGAVAIASDGAPDEPELVALYEAAKEAGADDVVVALAAPAPVTEAAA